MATRYELREAGTGRLLGTVDLVDDLSPGDASLLLASRTVQVEKPATPAPDAPAAADADAPARTSKRSRK